MGRPGALSLGALLLPINATWAQKPEEKKQIELIVKIDDDAKAVVVPDGKIETTGIFVLDDAPATFTEAKTIVLKGEPIKLDGSAITLHDSLAVVSDDATDSNNNSNVNVILKTDDSAVSVSADSIEDAIKKINEQIKSLKEKGSSGKEKSQQEALTKIAKQLAEIAKSNKVVSPKGDRTTERRVVIRNVQETKSSPASPEKKAEIDKARARVKELSAALAAAHADLAKLEGHGPHTFSFTTSPDLKTTVNPQFKVMAVPKLSEDNLNVIVRDRDQVRQGGCALQEDRAQSCRQRQHRSAARRSPGPYASTSEGRRGPNPVPRKEAQPAPRRSRQLEEVEKRLSQFPLTPLGACRVGATTRRRGRSCISFSAGLSAPPPARPQVSIREPHPPARQIMHFRYSVSRQLAETGWSGA